jgi:probable addiction module antidote protein
MSLKPEPFGLLRQFDVVDFLQTGQDVAAYLAAALEDRDPSMLVIAVNDIARATRTELLHRTPPKT